MSAESHLPTLVLITARIAALVLVAPGLASRYVPWRARGLLVVLLVVPSFCVCPASNVITPTSLPRLVVHEAVIGLSLAMVPAVMIWGLAVAWQSLAGLAGLPGSVEGGSEGEGAAPSAPLERFFQITVLAIYFTAGGHQQLIQAMLESFRWLPPGHHAPLESAPELLVDLLSQSFAFGLRALSPLIVALILSILAFAAMNRALPQLGYFAVGMNAQALVLLASLISFLWGMGWLVDGEFATAAVRAESAWKHVMRAVP